jgi:hypothetical protein
MRRHCFELAAVILAVQLSACGDASVNDDVHVKADGRGVGGAMTLNGNVFVEKDTVVEDGDFSTVNGNIEIAERAQVQSVRAVNGNIRIADGARARDVESVNGRLEIGRDAQIGGSVKLVNGDVGLAKGALVGGSIATVNGEIVAHGATIEGSVANYAGGMQIMDGSVVKGSLTVHEPEDMDGEREPPRIVIGPDSRVLGRLKFERPVTLYVHETAEVGPVDGAEPIRYAGDLPEAT